MAQLLLRGQFIGSVKAVLFDKDGTLSHSEPMLHALATERIKMCLHLSGLAEGNSGKEQMLGDLLGRAYGLEERSIHPAGTTAVACREHNLIATATAFVQVGFDWPDALQLSETAFALTDSFHGQRSRHSPEPTEGLYELLVQLESAGIVCAVISNDHTEGIHAFLSQHGLSHFFNGVWSAEHYPAKPHPGAVRGLCSRLGIDPAQCALIGDANSDLRMARAAGVGLVLGYPSGWLRRASLDPGFTQVHQWSELRVAPESSGWRRERVVTPRHGPDRD